jgi:hypothetical protein
MRRAERCLPSPKGEILVRPRQHSEGLSIGAALVGELAQKAVGPLDIPAARDSEPAQLPQPQTRRERLQALLHGVVCQQRLALPKMSFDGIDRRLFLGRWRLEMGISHVLTIVSPQVPPGGSAR